MTDRPSRHVIAHALSIVGVAVAVLLGCGLPLARADNEAEASDVLKARDEFVRGAEYVKRTQWAEALEAFERSAKIRPHPVTTYNIGVCNRAMGHYMQAREAFSSALATSTAEHALPESIAIESRGYVEEIDKLLAKVTVTLDPPAMSLVVDGRPLAPRSKDGVTVLLAGLLAPGHGAPAPARIVQIVLDPGTHVFTLSYTGYRDAVVNRTFRPGEATRLELSLDHLPADFRIASEPAGAAVSLAGADVGMTPLVLSRPAGNYHVVLQRSGWAPYEADIAAHAGENVDLRAKLSPERHPITKKWWFWGALGVVVASVAVSTYFIVRAETATQPPLDGGGLGWTVPLK